MTVPLLSEDEESCFVQQGSQHLVLLQDYGNRTHQSKQDGAVSQWESAQAPHDSHPGIEVKGGQMASTRARCAE